MNRVTHVPMRALVSHAVGGGWGYELPAEGLTEVAIIRGADFPATAVGETQRLPLRWEESRKVPQRTLQGGDIVLEVSGGTNERPTGRTVFASDRLLESIGRTTIPASFCRLVRIDPSKADPYYVYWWLQGMYADGRTWAYQNRSTGIANFQFEYFLDTETVALPSLKVQRSIAAILGSLDNKIESNRRQLKLLDSLLQTNWLKSAASAAETKRLGDVVSTQYGLTASAGDHLDAPRFLRVTDINKENWVTWGRVPTVKIEDSDWKKYRLHKGDLLVARMADPGKSAIYDDESVDGVFASYLVRLRAADYAESLYVYGFLKSSLYADYAAGAMTGSVQKNMNARVIVAVALPWPSRSEIDAFAQLAGSFRSQINQRVSENAKLEGTRDALLPELLSGRIRVPEAADAITDELREMENT